MMKEQSTFQEIRESANKVKLVSTNGSALLSLSSDSISYANTALVAKLQWVRLNFTLVASVLKEITQHEKRPSSNRRLSAFSVIHEKLDLDPKVEHCCRKQDFNLLHFKTCFSEKNRIMKSVFNWKLQKCLFAEKYLLSKPAKEENLSLRRRIINTIELKNDTKEGISSWKEELEQALELERQKIQREERHYLLTRVTNYFVK